MTRPRTLVRDSVLRLAGLISSIVLSVPACAQQAQPLDTRFLLGVGTHQGLGGPVSERGYVPAENIAQIKQLGFNAFRDDFPWSDFEVGGRRMGFTPRLGRLEAQVKSGVARPLLILAFGHHLVPNSSPPTTDEARQRFADYAAAAAQSVVAQHPLFELWNEWNLAAKKDAAFSPENYLALAEATRPAVKRVAPNAPFLVGALGDDPGWTWTEKMLRTGILQYADGASIHLYNFCMGPSKRSSAEIIERLTAFHRLVGQASGNADFPIYVTETGWTTPTNKCGVSEQAQADNTAQLILWASTATRWLKGIWIYELKDSGKNPSELEHNFGLYRFDNSPKPVACAAQGAWAFIRSSLSAERRELASGVVSINASTTSGGRVAVWSEAPDRRYEIRLKGDQQGATYALPCDAAATPASGAWIPVSSTPVLIAAKNGAAPALEIRPAR
ncbi:MULTISPECIES: hypothetical protein [Bradyrhizobium]|uniref:Glycoside hydrolase family 5 domain-containing protein n=1 Tax=Bradyrhizobium vignae TaxID=1549949 RepID=A0A2U3Q829_9BRAD|nr:hypothetical protein [Bradyrhizobium vignae]SPP97572.1 conserved exported protein of unknown function [Bradyrhizobium vignae]